MKEIGALGRLDRGGSVGLYVQNKFQQLAGTPLTVGKVVSTILDESHPRFQELGQYASIGVVEYAIDTNVGAVAGVAFPLNRSLRKYPIVGEFILIINPQGLSRGPLQGKSLSFYIGLIDVWNTVNHNSFPFDLTTIQNINYATAETGFTNPITATTQSYFFGTTFEESPSVKPLQAFEGDMIIEGRWGNTIRLSSTVLDVKTKKGVNNWSLNNIQNGSPITILRNGQSPIQPKEYKQVIEDINEDLSSIYLTSDQKINIRVAQTNTYTSYKTQTRPIAATEFMKSQIIHNADRILLNSKTDHILLSSAQTINLNATDSINIDTPGSLIVQAKKVLLGSATAPEPVLLGDKTHKLLESLLNAIEAFMTAAETTVSTPPGTALGQLNITAGLVKGNIVGMKQLLNEIRSETTFTE